MGNLFDAKPCHDERKDVGAQQQAAKAHWLRIDVIGRSDNAVKPGAKQKQMTPVLLARRLGRVVHHLALGADPRHMGHIQFFGLPKGRTLLDRQVEFCSKHQQVSLWFAQS